MESREPQVHTRSEDSGSDEAEPPKIARTLDLQSPTAAQPAVQVVPTLESVAEGHARSVQLPAVAPMAPGQPPSRRRKARSSLPVANLNRCQCSGWLRVTDLCRPADFRMAPVPLPGIPSVTHGKLGMHY